MKTFPLVDEQKYIFDVNESIQFIPMNVSFDITRVGGHLSKVKFRVGRQTVEPFSTAPWCDTAEAKKLIPLLRVLRGDFFCAPFGAGPAWQGEAQVLPS